MSKHSFPFCFSVLHHSFCLLVLVIGIVVVAWKKGGNSSSFSLLSLIAPCDKWLEPFLVNRETLFRIWKDSRSQRLLCLCLWLLWSSLSEQAMGEANVAASLCYFSCVRSLLCCCNLKLWMDKTYVAFAVVPSATDNTVKCWEMGAYVGMVVEWNSWL